MIPMLIRLFRGGPRYVQKQVGDTGTCHDEITFFL
jgi:hypothetical protein